jgi:DUF1009 family protein
MPSSQSDKPLGLIAGSGALPLQVAKAQNGAVFVVALQGEAEQSLHQYPHIISPIGCMKAAADALLAAGCTEMVIIGGIQRPNMEELEFDEGGQWFLEQVMSGAHEGDDQLLKVIIAYFEMRGLTVCPAQHYIGDQTGKAGPQTGHDHSAHQSDIDRAIEVAGVMGVQDIGQSVAVGRRLVLAVEGPEGTDSMLQRLRDLSPEFLGTANARSGVLAKLPKPQQDRRVDIPAIGQRTIELAAAAQLAGIGFEAGGTLFDDFEAVVALAEEKGLFLLGLERQS